MGSAMSQRYTDDVVYLSRGAPSAGSTDSSASRPATSDDLLGQNADQRPEKGKLSKKRREKAKSKAKMMLNALLSTDEVPDEVSGADDRDDHMMDVDGSAA